MPTPPASPLAGNPTFTLFDVWHWTEPRGGSAGYWTAVGRMTLVEVARGMLAEGVAVGEGSTFRFVRAT